MHVRPIFEPRLWNDYKIIGLEVPGNCSDQFRSNTFRFYDWRDKDLTFPWFLDLWTRGDHCLWIWIYQITFENTRSMGTFWTHICCCEVQKLHDWKDGHRNMMKVRLTNLGNLGYGIDIYLKTWNQNLVIKLRN